MRPPTPRHGVRIAVAAVLLPLTSCGHQIQPTPTDAALAAPEGAPPQPPPEPAPLKPPPRPPEPGYINHHP